MQRATDTRADLRDFNETTMLRCARCRSLAWSRTLVADVREAFAPRRLTCVGCGYAKAWYGRRINRPRGQHALDDYFHLPLYLQVPTPYGVLWAYNTEHLAYLRTWVEAELRGRSAHPLAGWANTSYLSRLPRWVKVAKHRDTLVAALRKLTALAQAAAPAPPARYATPPQRT